MLSRLNELVAPEPLALVIFDLDGTLVDSAADLRMALDRMYDELSLRRATEGQVREWVGNGAEMLVKRALSYDLAAPSVDEGLLQNGETSGEASACYEGDVDLLECLRKSGVKVAIATNKPARFTMPLLDALNIEVDFVISGDEVSAKKPDPMQLMRCLEHFSCDVRQAVMVGDSSNDLLAAKACAIKNVAVSYGYNHGVSISSFGPDLLIDSLTELR